MGLDESNANIGSRGCFRPLWYTHIHWSPNRVGTWRVQILENSIFEIGWRVHVLDDSAVQCSATTSRNLRRVVVYGVHVERAVSIVVYLLVDLGVASSMTDRGLFWLDISYSPRAPSWACQILHQPSVRWGEACHLLCQRFMFVDEGARTRMAYSTTCSLKRWQESWCQCKETGRMY